jgi:type I restriction enzyme M protein
LDYVEQTSWILFLKYLDDLETDRVTWAELAGAVYKPLILPKYRWANWAVPKTSEGKVDHNKARLGDDLKDFVDQELFPYLKRFKSDALSADTIEYKIGEIFSELKNKIQSGYNLREVLDVVDGMRFRSNTRRGLKIWGMQDGTAENITRRERSSGRLSKWSRRRLARLFMMAPLARQDFWSRRISI